MRTTRSSAIPPIDVDELRRRYLQTLDTLQAKGIQVRDALDEASAVLDFVREHVERGGEISDFAGTVDPKSLRASLSSSLDDLERARHRSQRVLFQILEAEGRSKSDIARVFGISRQLVSRMLHEPDD